MALRKCNHCDKVALNEEELELFAKASPSHQMKYNRCNTCKECAARKKREAGAKDKNYHRRSNVKAMYGITLEEYNKVMEENTECKLCGSSHRLVYDHCHETMKFRGVLCSACNAGLGMYKENIEVMQKAIEYLKTGGGTCGI